MKIIKMLVSIHLKEKLMKCIDDIIIYCGFVDIQIDKKIKLNAYEITISINTFDFVEVAKIIRKYDL